MGPCFTQFRSLRFHPTIITMTLPSVSKLLTTSTVLLAVTTPGVSASSSSSGRFAVVRQRTSNSNVSNDYWRERMDLGTTTALERSVRFRSAQNAFVTDHPQQQQHQRDDWYRAETATTKDNDTVVGRFALEYEPERSTMRSAENAHIRMRHPRSSCDAAAVDPAA